MSLSPALPPLLLFLAATGTTPEGGPPARRVSLHEVLEHADAHAPAVQLARTRLLYGDAALAGASPLFPDNPTVSGAWGKRRGAGADGTDWGVSIEQPLEIFGQRGLRLEAAEARQARLEAELTQARWEVHRLVHAGFHSALVGRERALAAERLVAFSEQLLEVARRRLQAGDVSQLTVRLAEAEAAQARQTRLAAAQDYVASRLALAELSGWTGAELLDPAGELDVPRAIPTDPELWRIAEAKNPGLARLRLAVTEAQARAALAGREAWPQPTLGASYEREGVSPQGGGESIWLGTLSLPLPLWRRNQGTRAETEADLRLSQTELETELVQARLRLSRSAGAVRTGSERVRLYGMEILPSFETNLTLLRRAYELGEVDLLQVSVARERFLQIQDEALDTYEAYYAAIAGLEAELGAELWPDDEHGHTRSEGAP